MARSDYMYTPYNLEYYIQKYDDPFLQSAEDWPSWDWDFRRKVIGVPWLGDHVLENKPAVAEVPLFSRPKPADYHPIHTTRAANGRVENAKRELQALENGDAFYTHIMETDTTTEEDNNKVPDRHRQEILADLVISRRDLTFDGKDLLNLDQETFEYESWCWETFNKHNTKLRNWMRESVGDHYAHMAMKPEWDTCTWYQKLQEVAARNYRGPGKKALYRMAWDNLRHHMGYPPHFDEALWEKMKHNALAVLHDGGMWWPWR